ncbi:MAG: RraA family protein [Candidatus Omnitrophota bacterium]|jgi:regulator of RNase E activity RraA|nr:MAG: RraA family protein [Candidatus Omnitrophota bacterium]
MKERIFSCRLPMTICILFAVYIFSGCASVPLSRSSGADPLIEGFSQIAVASVSDAIDQIIGKRGFMSHEMRPVFPTKMCGYAVTVLARPSTEKEPPSMALDLIDNAEPGKVLVIVMEGEEGKDVAAFGGIMCTGCVARGFAGAVLDGGCRDVAEIREMGFPVFSRSICPTNSVGRYVNTAKNEPVICGDIEVRPGDIILGDEDGVAVIPHERADEILRLAQELEVKEAVTAKAVKQLKSIRKATQQHGRI